MRTSTLLAPVLRCPVCGSTQRQHSRTQMKRKSNRYLEGLALAKGADTAELIAAMTEFECRNCGAVYLDPHLSSAAERCLYEVTPMHRRGLQRLEERLARRAGRPDITQLWNAVTKHLGPIQLYAEVGCPFQGALLEGADSRRLRTISRLLRWGHLKRSFAPTSSTHERWRSAAIALRSVGVLGAYGNGALFSQSIHVRADFPEAWLPHCSVFGTPCSMLGEEIASAISRPLPNAATTQIDLVGIFNWLDHVADPLQLLREIALKSRGILLTGHLAVDAGLQHRFGLTNRSLLWLASQLGMMSQDLLGTSHQENSATYAVLFVHAGRKRADAT